MKLQIQCAIIIFAALCGCGGRHPPVAAGAGASGQPGGLTDAEKRLNVFSWSDYIAPDTIANFEKETGIKVHYDIYFSDDVLETKLLTGHSNYDIVVPTDTYFEHEIKAGAFGKLDKRLLKGSGNLDASIMSMLAVHDPNNEHAVPYMWSTAGLGYDAAAVRKRLGDLPVDSWSVMFDPKIAAKLADCGIAMLDAPPDVMGSVLIYMGRDPNSQDPADLGAAAEVLMKIRPFIRYIDSSQYISDLAGGSICMALGWSGDILQARARAIESGNHVDVSYRVPREGAFVIVDMMSIPADAPHPRNAHRWMDYLMRPEVIADISNHIKYANGNAASLPFIQDAIKNDPGIYPDAATRARLHPHRADTAEKARLETRLWTRFRTGF